ncbi:MAG: hypothetical protein DI535_09075 [Citrobacter freundii]|nr:MAG: hypothetical protein DI535_09075 [Citrobacter freundii]
MRHRVLYLLILLVNSCCLHAQSSSQDLSGLMKEAAKIRRLPVTDERFRTTCDLAQSAALLNLDSGYRIIQQYLPRVKAGSSEQFILLMGWAKAETALGGYATADSVYRLIRNTWSSDSREYRESCVAAILLWTEYEKLDSVKHYFPVWKTFAEKANDHETLSFLYCFRTMGFYLQNQQDSMQLYFNEAIRLATPLANKNALFTAKYNYANLFLQRDPQRQIIAFNELRELAADPSLAHYPPKLYERTAFSFRNAGPSVAYQLMQLNLLMADYDVAGRFAQEFYDATVKPNPSSGQAPLLNAEMAIVKAYQGDWTSADQFLSDSRAGFERTKSPVGYPGYYIAAALIAEHAKNYPLQLELMQKAYSLGRGRGLYVVPVELHYAHALISNQRLKDAEELFRSLPPFIQQHTYTAPGLYYYQYLAELRKAQGQTKQYVDAMNAFYEIKDSLISYNRYRAIQEVLVKMQVKEKEQQISLLNTRQIQLQSDLRKERLFYGVVLSLLVIIILLLVKMRRSKIKQQAALHQHEITRLARERELQEVQAVMAAEQRQRSVIATALHNEVNSMLSLSILNISSELEKDQHDAKRNERLRHVWDGLDQVSRSIRELSHRLDAPSLAVTDFKLAVKQMVEMANSAGKLKTELILVGLDDSSRHSPTLLAALHLILQELFQNIVKHAQATHALIEIVEHDDHLSVMVEDNGTGMHPKPETNGVGLKMIREKIEALRGTIEIVPGSEQGTLVVIDIPLTERTRL